LHGPFLEEIGIDTVLAGSGGESSTLKKEIDKISNGRLANIKVLNDLDFETIMNS
jgi:hypothetical protein